MRLLSIPEAAKRADKPESHIRRACVSRKLRSYRVGTAYAIEESDLAAYLGRKPEPEKAETPEPENARIVAPAPTAPPVDRADPASQPGTRPGGAPDLSGLSAWGGQTKNKHR